MKILIVDDDDSNVALLESRLARAGFSCVKSVLDSRYAVDVCKGFAPDLLLLDLMMPFVDGFAVLESLRDPNGGLILPVIVLTADVEPETKLRVLKTGATDFLTKPLDLAEVLARITNVLESRRRELLMEKQRKALEEALAATSELRSALWQAENKQNSYVVL
jgi:putative two-component system response regulator